MLLEELCNSSSPSGYEGDTRNLLKNQLTSMELNFSTDKMGSILVHKKYNKNSNSPKIMLAAHMDETGLIITSFNSDGTLKFSTLGNIDINSLPCKVVLIGNHKIKGVIGLKPIHLQNRKERNKKVAVDDLCIDIGTYSKEESKRIISLGDYAVFDVEFENISQNIVKAKALNDRIGCYVLLQVLRENYNCELYGAFNIQENVGGRGAFVTNYNVKPDIFISIDAICANDFIDESFNGDSITLGQGPVIPFKAGISMFNREIVKSIRQFAGKMDIDYQKFGGSIVDGQSRSAQVGGLNSKIAAVLIPCRHMNSIISMCNLDDCNSTIDLLKSYLKSF